MVKLSKEETRSYLERIMLGEKMKSALKNFAENFPFKKRRNKKLYDKTCILLFRMIKSSMRQGDLFSPFEFHSDDIEQILGKNHVAILNGLIEARIISTNHVYKRPKSVEIKYMQSQIKNTKNPAKIKSLQERIISLENDKEYKSHARFFSFNINLLSGRLVKFSFQVSKSLAEPDQAPKDSFLKKIYKDQRKIRINYKKIEEEIIENLDAKLHLHNHKINYDVNSNFFESIQVWDEENQCLKMLTNVDINSLVEEYGSGDTQLIKNDKTYYYISLARFHEIKTINTYYSHMYKLLMLDAGKIFVKREYKDIVLPDGTIERRFIRIHTTLTSTPSFFRKHMRQYKRSLKNLDLCNSQFMFLIHCLTDRTTDNRITAFANINGYALGQESSILFFHLCREGILYEYIAKEIGCSRKKAKGFCFAVLFDNKRNNEGNRLIKKLFPEMYEFLCAFKLHHGYKELSSELQFVEASIIVDDIYACHLSHLNGHTIHDSFFYDWKQFEKMRVIVIRRLNKIIGKGNYRTKVE